MDADQNIKAAEKQANKLDERQAEFVKLGSKLKTLREAQKLAIAQISDQTKIQRQYIKSIEDGKLETLPKGPYTRSFLRQYCTYLRAEDLWRAYDALTSDQKVKIPKYEVKEENSFQTTSPKVFKHRSTWWIYALVAVSLVAAAYLTWNYRSDMSSVATNPMGGGTAPVANAPTSDEQPPAPTVSDAAAKNASTSVDLGWMDGKAPQPKAAPAPAPVSGDQPKPAALQSNELKIVPLGVVWVKVSQGNTVFFQGIMQVSEDKVYTVSEEEPLRIRFGNPAKSAVEWQGKTSGPLGKDKKPITRYYWSDGKVTDKK